MTPFTRPSRSSSWRRISSRARACFSPRGGANRMTSRRSGRRILQRSKATRAAPSSSRPTARASSVAANRSARRSRSPKAGRSPTPRAASSIRSSVCVAAFACPEAETVRVSFWTLIAPIAAGCARPRRQASRTDRVRARQHAGLDARARTVPPSGHRSRGSASVPAPREPHPVLRSDAEAAGRSAEAGRPQHLRPLGARHLGRSSDRAVAHRRRGRPRHRAPVAARVRILASEALGRRHRDPERARRHRICRICRARSTAWSVRSRRRPPGGRDDVRGSVYVLRTDLIPAEIKALLYAVARIVLVSRRGTLYEQVSRLEEAKLPVLFTPPEPPSATPIVPVPRGRPQLEFFNGLGGFAERGREYVTILDQGHRTPAPWINVIANPAFRIPGLGRWRRLHLVAEQPTEPDHALVERSDWRSGRRGDLSSRRRQRRSVVADDRADPRGERLLHGSSRTGLLAVRA